MLIDKLTNLPIFETKRLIVRPLKLSDAEDMHEYASDYENTKYMFFDAHKDIDTTYAHIKDVLERYKIGNCLNFVFELKGNSKVIGAGGAFNFNNTKCVDIGYIINKRYWGQGYTAEALNSIVDYLFNTLDVHRIEAGHFSPNKNSGRVMQKLGMVYEGEQIDKYFVRGEYYNRVLYGMINPKHLKILD